MERQKQACLHHQLGLCETVLTYRLLSDEREHEDLHVG